MIVSVLMFGSPLFACLGDASITLAASREVFCEAEKLASEVMRWALSLKRDTRISVMHLLGNCENV